MVCKGMKSLLHDCCNFYCSTAIDVFQDSIQCRHWDSFHIKFHLQLIFLFITATINYYTRFLMWLKLEFTDSHFIQFATLFDLELHIKVPSQTLSSTPYLFTMLCNLFSLHVFNFLNFLEVTMLTASFH